MDDADSEVSQYSVLGNRLRVEQCIRRTPSPSPSLLPKPLPQHYRRPSWLKTNRDLGNARQHITEPQDPKEDSHRSWPIWSTYAQEAMEYDHRLTKEWNESMDVLLIFAGLFSAVVTCFLQISMLWLEPNYAQITAQIAYATYTKKPGQTSLDPDSHYTPTDWNIRVNVFWVVALLMSLGVALFAMLSKAWVREFIRVLPSAPYDKAHHRQFRLDGVDGWHMAGIMELLPIILHVSVVLFCCGLVDYSFHCHSLVICISTTAACGLLLGTYTVFCILPFFDPKCPYKTPWSRAFGVTPRQSFAASQADMKKAPKVGSRPNSRSDAEREMGEARAMVWLFLETADQDVAAAALMAALNLDDLVAQMKVLTCPGVLPILCRMFLKSDEDKFTARILRAVDLVCHATDSKRLASTFTAEDEILHDFHAKLVTILQTSASDDVLSAAIKLADGLLRHNTFFLPMASHFSITRLVYQIGSARFSDSSSLAAALQVTAYVISLPGYRDAADSTFIEEDNVRHLLSVVTSILKTNASSEVQESALSLVQASTEVVKSTPPGWLQLNQDLYLDPKSGLLSAIIPLLSSSSSIDCFTRRRIRDVLCSLMSLEELGQRCQSWIVEEDHISSIVHDFDSFHVTQETRDDCTPFHLLVQTMSNGRLLAHFDAFLSADVFSALRAHFDRNRYDRPPLLLADIVELYRSLLSLVGTAEEMVLKDSGILPSMSQHFKELIGMKDGELRELGSLLMQAKAFGTEKLQ